jgi:hypothetical protein
MFMLEGSCERDVICVARCWGFVCALLSELAGSGRVAPWASCMRRCRWQVGDGGSILKQLVIQGRCN